MFYYQHRINIVNIKLIVEIQRKKNEQFIYIRIRRNNYNVLINVMIITSIYDVFIKRTFIIMLHLNYIYY